jgi:hypothetical protein
MFALVALATTAHVPTYGEACKENCCQPTRHHTISQAVFLKGAGGLEVHLLSDSEPFDQTIDEIIDIDLVFKEEIDPSLFSVHIGCGGCVASEDAVLGSPIPVLGYKPAVLEPFTQTVYRSVILDTSQTHDWLRPVPLGQLGGYHFYSSRLLSGCNASHFTIRIVTDEEFYYSPVIGILESFTIEELISFPLFVLRNHGESWAQLGFTIYINTFLLAPLVLFIIHTIRKWLGWSTLTALFLHRLVIDVDNWQIKLIVYKDVWVREYFYEAAIFVYVAVTLEILMHTDISQRHLELDWAFPTAIGIALFANVGPILYIRFLWQVLLDSKRNQWYLHRDDAGAQSCAACSASPFWAPIELATAFSLLLLFGSGFLLGPALLGLAAIVRHGEIVLMLRELRKKPFERVVKGVVQPEQGGKGEQPPKTPINEFAKVPNPILPLLPLGELALRKAERMKASKENHERMGGNGRVMGGDGRV